MSVIKTACLQLRTGVDPAANLQNTRGQISEAAANGATFITTPEMTNCLDIRPGMSTGKLATEAEDITLKALREQAAELGVWILIGSLAIALEDEPRKANRSFLIAPSGEIVARYDKIHMFDVEVGDGQSYRESNAYRAGDRAVVVQTAIAKIGMSICYDVRFPGLYRELARAGSEILTVPAAFTRVTGEAHWHSLLQARAIETGCFVVAPAQGGKHEDGRETYGHSMIVSPWGEILAEADHCEPDIIYAELDLNEVSSARSRIPSLASERSYILETVSSD